MRSLVTMLAFLLFTAGWSESLTLEEYLQLKKEDSPTSQQIIHAYIGGLGEGLSWANTECETECKKRIYCTPKSVSLSHRSYVEIFNKQLEEGKGKDKNLITTELDKPILAAILSKGLKETFPCEKK